MYNHTEVEKEILVSWNKNKIYEKSKKKNAKGKKFYFMDGPPYATGHIHLGTALNKITKDIAMRSRRLQGFDVFDRPGYDTHGVPIELQVEKEIGSKSKQDIEKFGVEKFVERCKKFATQYIDIMNDEFKNLGVWMDWDNPYLTLSDEYIEAIWSAFKEADKKKLLYLGKYPVHVCSRCETAVAFNEIEYGKQKDNSIFVKFPLKDKKNTFLIIWTTTPWTLPANTGVMVHPDAIYQEVEVAEGERWIIAKDLLPKIMTILERGFTAKDEYVGKKMLGWKYTTPMEKNISLLEENKKNAYRVVTSARYVTTEDGSGLVHCAPGHGKEDYEVGKEFSLPAPSPVATNGILTSEAGKYSGKKARQVDAEIIQDLKDDGFLVYQLQYEHDYPLCWRDKTPLLMISQPQWFLKISEIHKKILKENEKTNWVPEYMKLRMKAWLEGISDWPVSRQRYWGTPLPIWRNEKTGEHIVVGSVEELQKLSGVKKISLHKPQIDSITIKGKTGILKRVSEVLDVWFDSGVSSWAALGYPKNKTAFKKYWPAELNIEGKDQFRGWWNSQIILSEIMFDKKPFNSIMVHGLVTDISKKKLSKSLGNSVAPQEVIARHGRDALRYYFAKLSKGEDFAFYEKEFSEIQKVFTILLNVNNFVSQLGNEKGKKEIEDEWILSKYNSLVRDVREAYNSYKFFEAIQLLEQFVINDLSRTYIKMIRERSEETKKILEEIFSGVLQLYAPICPFMMEHLWKKKNSNDSIHLSLMPKEDTKKINVGLEENFSTVLLMIEKGLAERDKQKIGLRWPLASVTVLNSKKLGAYECVLSQQLNVKKILWKKSGEGELSVELDTTMTKELEAEGYSRELARKIQAERKKIGLEKKDFVSLYVHADSEIISMLKMHEKFLQERVNAKKIDFSDDKKETGVTVEIKGKKIFAEITPYRR